MKASTAKETYRSCLKFTTPYVKRELNFGKTVISGEISSSEKQIRSLSFNEFKVKVAMPLLNIMGFHTFRRYWL